MAAAKQNLFAVNFITGLSDGLLLPLAAGIIARPLCAQHFWPAVVAGIAVSLIGAIAFGMARFLGEKEEIRHHHPELARADAEEEIALMNAIGIDPGLTADMKAKMEEERLLWLREVKEHELGWENYDVLRARKSGWQTAAGFLAGGVLVSLLFVSLAGLLGSQLKTMPAVLVLMAALGWYKGRLTGKPAGTAILHQLTTGLVIAAAAWVIAWLALMAAGRSIALIDL